MGPEHNVLHPATAEQLTGVDWKVDELYACGSRRCPPRVLGGGTMHGAWMSMRCEGTALEQARIPMSRGSGDGSHGMKWTQNFLFDFVL